MKLKTILIAGLFVSILFGISEIANYLSNPASPISIIANRFFINKSISFAKDGQFNNSLYYLSIASKINTFGEFDPYRNLMPSDYSKSIVFTNDGQLEYDILNYLSGLSPNDLTNGEDQGLAWIYYNIGLIAYKDNQPEVTEQAFKMAVYNHPEFPSFHAELINYYFTKGQSDQVTKQMDYCYKFKIAKSLCELYKNDSLVSMVAHPIGFMKIPLEQYYNN